MEIVLIQIAKLCKKVTKFNIYKEKRYINETKANIHNPQGTIF